jgi:4-amino-4-deoxy-L-arabinose transferase-like glycosyltransferase
MHLPEAGHDEQTGAVRGNGARELSSKQSVALLAMIVAAAVALRVWHIGWGLPDVFEEATPFMRAWRFWKWDAVGLSFDPRFFNYPAFTFYLHWLVQAVHYGIGHLSGTFADLDGFRDAFLADPTTSLLIARGVNIAFDVGTVIALSALAARLLGRSVALIVGGLSAINPLQVQMAQQVNVDVPMTFFVTLSLYFMIRLSEDPKERWYALSGLFIGLAASCKYTAAILLAPLLLAGMISAKAGTGTPVRRSLGNTGMAIGISILAFLAINPFVIINFDAFRRGFAFEAHHMAAGHFGIRDDSSSLAYYFLESIPFAFGWIVVAASSLGVLAVVLRLGTLRRWIPILCYLAIMFAILSSWKMHADRYTLPAIPGVLLLAGAGVYEIRSIVGRFAAKAEWLHGRTAIRLSIMLLLVLLLYWPTARRLVGYQTRLAKEDTRTAVREFITENAKPSSVVAMGPLGLTLPAEYNVLPIPYVVLGLPAIAAFYDARWYVDCDFVIGSDFDRARYLVDLDLYAPFLQYFYDSLDTRWRIVHTIEPGSALQGPAIWLYAPTDSLSTERFPADLVDRLATVRNARLLVGFGLNLSSVLDAKRKPGKADQVWKEVSFIILSKFDAREILTMIMTLRPEIRQMKRVQDLERMIRTIAS